MGSNNIKIRNMEAKDIIKGNFTSKYIGSIDNGLETDYIEESETMKDSVYIVDNQKYSDDFVNISFKYSWEIGHDELLEKGKDNEIYKKVNNLIKEAKESIDTEKESRKTLSKKEDIENHNITLKIKEKYYNKIREEKIEMLIDEEYRNKNLKSEESEEDEEKIKKEKIELKKKYIKSTKILRDELYMNGFFIDDKKFVRYKRSSGSARVGKCLFIEEKRYEEMIKWSFAGIDIENKKIDIAGIESYIALSLSSSIGRFELHPSSILLIDDKYSTFEDDVMATTLGEDGMLTTEEKKIKISNNIFDGQALICNSVFENNKDLPELKYKATMQIRNKFYKGQAIRCDLQKFYKEFYKDKYETATVSDMKGNKILVKDIKLVTTPSSIKYLKYGEYEAWKEQVKDVKWTICKYDKSSHNFNSMVQTHYQLLNTSQMTSENMEEFLKPTIEYINLIKNDDAVFKNHIRIKSSETIEDATEDEDIEKVTECINDTTIEDATEENNDDLRNTNDFIFTMLANNSEFINSRICKDFRSDSIDSYINNVRSGHVLIDGNYSIVANNVVEMLYASVDGIEEVDDRLQIKSKPNIKLNKFEVISKKYDKGEMICAVRSPQPTFCNVSVYRNMKNYTRNEYFLELEKYFTLTKEIIFTNSINVNRMEKMSGEDFDIDSELITNNKYIVECAQGLQDFKVSNDLTPKTPNPLIRNNANLSKVDVLCSTNKIGEIINLIQSLNSLYCDKMALGVERDSEELKDLYNSICNLNVLSMIEIDRCKKTSVVNADNELQAIRNKKYLENKKPHFFKYCNEFKVKGAKKPKYEKFNCGMDYLNTILDKNLKYSNRRETLKLHEFIKADVDHSKERRDDIKKMLALIEKMINETSLIYKDSEEDKYNRALKVEVECIEEIGKYLKNEANMIRVLTNAAKYMDYKIEIGEYNSELKKIEKNISKIEAKKYETKELKSEKKELEKSVKEIKNKMQILSKKLEKLSIYKYSRKILKTLFKVDSKMFMDCFKSSEPKDFIVMAESDEEEKYCEIYGVPYKKIN